MSTLRSSSNINKVHPLSVSLNLQNTASHANSPRLSQTEKIGKSFRFIKTINTCVELRSLREKFYILNNKIKNFLHLMPQNLVDLNLCKEFQVFTQAFESFMESALAQFNSIKAKSSLPQLAKRKNYSLQKRSNNLTKKIEEFVETINILYDGGINPHTKLMKTSFEILFSSIAAVTQSSLQARLSTDKSIHTVNQLNINSSGLRNIIMKILQQPRNIMFDDFREEDIFAEIRNITQKAGKVFKKGFPLGILSPPYVEQLRVQINASCSDIGNIICNASHFDSDIMEIKTALINFNESYKETCTILSISGGAEIKFVEQAPVIESERSDD